MDRFPGTLGGEPFVVRAGSGGFNEQTDPRLLEAAGVGIDDVVVLSSAELRYPCADDTLCVQAYQYPGGDERTLADVYLDLRRRQGADLEPMARDDDKLVLTLALAPQDIVYLIRDDAIYVIFGEDDLIAELVAAIP